VPLLYIDVLGMKARWQSGDLDAVQRAYAQFERLVSDALAAMPDDTQFDASIQSDAVAVLFASVDSAVRVGRDIFRAAASLANAEERFWLRGVIVPAQPRFDSLENTTDQGHDFRRVRTRRFSDELLQAILVEQSGPKGARLLIADELITTSLKDAYAIRVGTIHIVPFRRLNNSSYPHPDRGTFRDVLWMLPSPYDDLRWAQQQRTMDNALRWAGGAAAVTRSDEEFAHAAATELVFKQCHAILGSIRTEEGRRAAKRAKRGNSARA
jgi:hypothetical protein